MIINVQPKKEIKQYTKTEYKKHIKEIDNFWKEWNGENK